MTKAIVIPEVNDANKGDQALVWESVRLAKDALSTSDVSVLVDRNMLQNMKQSEKEGIDFIDLILRHPRRGERYDGQHLNESLISLFKQAFRASADFLKFSFLLRVVKYPRITKLLFSKQVNKVLDEFRGSDVIFVKGGGFLHAHGERKAPFIIWYFLFYLKLAIKLNKKTILLPNSFGPFRGLSVKSQLYNTLKKVDVIYARESKSREELKRHFGLECDLSNDLGFYLPNLEDESIKERVGIIYPGLYDRKIVGLTVRPWRFPGDSNPAEKYQRYINVVARFIGYLVDKGYNVAISNQSLGPNIQEDDRESIKELLTKVQSRYRANVFWLDLDLNSKELKSLYATFSYFIGTRFHSIIFSLMNGVPSIAIAYGGNKAYGIMKDFSLEKYVISIDDIDDIKARLAFESLEQDRENVRESLFVRAEAMLNERALLIDDIRDKLQISRIND